jgi:hypothetical protein
MINRTFRRVALGATVAATFSGLAGTVHADDCVEIRELFPKLVQTDEYRVTEVCNIINILRPPNPSTSSGRGYRLPDGSILWLSEADWWAMMDKAAGDEGWRQDNRDLLVAVGIVECHLELIPTIQSIEITKQYQFCPPTWDPYERPY